MTTPQDIAARLPQPAELERRSIALAALDALLGCDCYAYRPGLSAGRVASLDGRADVLRALGQLGYPTRVEHGWADGGF